MTSAVKPPADATPPHLPALLGDVFERVLVSLALAEREGVRASHVRVLEAIGASGVRLTVMAASLRMTKQGAGQLVSTLSSRGLVDQRPDPQDGRARVLVLTDRGQALLDRVHARIRELERDWAAELGAGDYAALRSLLSRLADPPLAPRAQTDAG